MGDPYVTATHPALNSVCCYTLGGKPPCPQKKKCCPTPRAPEVGPTRVEEQHHPRPTYGALDHTAELLAKLLSGSEDPDVTALSEAIKAKLGIAEPLPKPELPLKQAQAQGIIGSL